MEHSKGGIIFSYVRMNPPTIGHRAVVNEVLRLSKDLKLPHIIVVSRTHGDRRNPLPPITKMEYIEKIVGHANYEVSEPLCPSMIQWLKRLNDRGYDRLVFVCGSDRLDEYRSLIERYNGKDFHFSSVVFSLAGNERGESNTISSSEARSLISHQNIDGFMQMYPDIDKSIVNELYEALSSFLINKDETGRRKGIVRGQNEEEKG